MEISIVDYATLKSVIRHSALYLYIGSLKHLQIMKTRRNLSGIYFRSKNEETGRYDNVVFEDLTREEQDKMMEGREVQWLKSLAIQLADTLNSIGDQFDIVS